MLGGRTVKKKNHFCYGVAWESRSSCSSLIFTVKIYDITFFHFNILDYDTIFHTSTRRLKVFTVFINVHIFKCLVMRLAAD